MGSTAMSPCCGKQNPNENEINVEVSEMYRTRRENHQHHQELTEYSNVIYDDEDAKAETYEVIYIIYDFWILINI